MRNYTDNRLFTLQPELGNCFVNLAFTDGDVLGNCTPSGAGPYDKCYPDYVTDVTCRKPDTKLDELFKYEG